jgi:hypothetical protein
LVEELASSLAFDEDVGAKGRVVDLSNVTRRA